MTVTPNASQIGQTVRGVLYVDTYNPVLNSGDEAKSFHYSYTVAP